MEKFKELIYTFEQNVKQKDEVISSMTEALKKQVMFPDKFYFLIFGQCGKSVSKPVTVFVYTGR